MPLAVTKTMWDFSQRGRNAPLFWHLCHFFPENSELFVITKNAPKTLKCKRDHTFVLCTGCSRIRGRVGVGGVPLVIRYGQLCDLGPNLIQCQLHTFLCMHLWSVELLNLSLENVTQINFKIIAPCAISGHTLWMTMGWTNDHFTCSQNDLQCQNLSNAKFNLFALSNERITFSQNDPKHHNFVKFIFSHSPPKKSQG